MYGGGATRLSTTRIRTLLLAITLAFGAIVGRLGYLQIARGEEYRRRAVDRSLRIDFLRPRRGTLWAHRGSDLEPLAEERPSHDVAVVLRDLDPAYHLVRKVARIRTIDPEEIDLRFRAIEERAREDPTAEFVLYPGLDSKTSRRLSRSIRKLPGIRTRARTLDGGTVFDIVIAGGLATRAERTLEALTRVVEIEPRQALEETRGWIRDAVDCTDVYQGLHDLRTPRPLLRDISFEEALRIEERHADLPGVTVIEGVRRVYPIGEAAGHLTGYLGPINKEEADDLAEEKRLVDRWRDLRQIDSIRELREGAHFKDDRVGRDGLERALESDLRGMVGAELVERDVRGTVVREIARLAPVPGEEMRLTIDLDLQEAAAEALAAAVDANEPATGGAVVAVDVQTGGILALFSYPSFDPSRFAKDYLTLIADPRRPLNNRAVRGSYAPGSVFKIVSAIAALETGVIRPGETVRCTGSFRPGSRWFKCSKKSGHGRLELREALQRSCNVFFYEMGERLGPDRLRDWGLRLGFGERTGVEIHGEGRGLLPSPEWLRQISKGRTPWTPGLNRNYAIGQGDIQVTPIQVAGLLAAVAGDNTPPPLHLRASAASPRTESGRTTRPGRGTLETVREGLRWVVQRPGGTAANRDGLKAVRAAGKTGTAQAGPDRNHAWFAGFAPSDRPRVAVAVVVEKVASNSHGGEVAGPVAAAVFAKALEESVEE